MAITVYELEGCPYCEKVADRLDELGVDYETVWTDALHSERDGVKRVSGQRSVPVLVDDERGVTMPESDRILEFAEKTALEYCGPEEFDSKPVGLLGVTEGSEPALALEHLRTVCTTLNAWVLPMQVSITAAGEHDELPTDSMNALRTLGQQVIDRVFHGTEGSGEDI